MNKRESQPDLSPGDETDHAENHPIRRREKGTANKPERKESVERKKESLEEMLKWHEDIDEDLAHELEGISTEEERSQEALRILSESESEIAELADRIPDARSIKLRGQKVEYSIDGCKRMCKWIEDALKADGTQGVREKIAEEWISSIFPVFYCTSPKAGEQLNNPETAKEYSEEQQELLRKIYSDFSRLVRTVIKILGLKLVGPQPGSPIPRDIELNILNRQQTRNPERTNTIKQTHRPGLRGPGVAISPLVDILLPV